MTSFVALLFASVAVGMGNFAASVGIGVSGVDRATRIRVGLVFGLFESGMPLIGLLIGGGLAHVIGGTGRYIGMGLLIATGLWTFWQTRSGGDEEESVSSTSTAALLLTGLALSIDNLVVGFSLGVQHINLVEALVTFAVVSVTLALIGLEFGKQLGARIEVAGDYLSAGVLVLVGILVGARVL